MAAGNGSSDKRSKKETYTFFWKKDSVFSQWYPCNFTVDGVVYNCAEQYMMSQKALLFGDKLSAEKIMATDNPKLQKNLGRSVSNFDGTVWDTECRDIVKRGNLAKFGQNEHLWAEMKATAGTILAEASPMDRIWGIGVVATDPKAFNKATWRGKNWLGYILTAVRRELQAIEDGQVAFSQATGDQATGGQAMNDQTTGGKTASNKTTTGTTTDGQATVDYSVIDQSIADEASSGAESYTFFWRKDSVFSQWYPCKFEVDGVVYNCTEQYMMHQKALIFGDNAIAEKIMATDNPKKMKALGRKVSNFSAAVWDKECRDVVRKGNLAKFGLNEQLWKEMESTSGTVLVEASPVDQIWGIGLAADHPKALKKANWRGKNWLGYMLTAVRTELLATKGGQKFS